MTDIQITTPYIRLDGSQSVAVLDTTSESNGFYYGIDRDTGFTIGVQKIPTGDPEVFDWVEVGW